MRGPAANHGAQRAIAKLDHDGKIALALDGNDTLARFQQLGRIASGFHVLWDRRYLPGLLQRALGPLHREVLEANLALARTKPDATGGERAVVRFKHDFPVQAYAKMLAFGLNRGLMPLTRRDRHAVDSSYVSFHTAAIGRHDLEQHLTASGVKLHIVAFRTVAAAKGDARRTSAGAVGGHLELHADNEIAQHAIPQIGVRSVKRRVGLHELVVFDRPRRRHNVPIGNRGVAASEVVGIFDVSRAAGQGGTQKDQHHG